MKINTNHAVYKEHDATCSQAQLVLMIYDAAIRYTREAANLMMANRWAEKGKAVESAHECLAELRRSLNTKEGGEVAASLDKMYDLLSTKLLYGNVTKDVDQFYQIVKSLETLRDAWKESFDRLKQEGYFAESKMPETYAVQAG
jgi:flagellar secretion chaperone FliS